MMGARTVEAVKARGRWRSDSSLRRYGKPAKAQQALRALPANVVAYGQLVEKQLKDIFEGRVSVPTPPGALKK